MALMAYFGSAQISSMSHRLCSSSPYWTHFSITLLESEAIDASEEGDSSNNKQTNKQPNNQPNNQTNKQTNKQQTNNKQQRNRTWRICAD
jgi:hypothetical protein